MIPFPKLTFSHLKMDGWNTILSLWVFPCIFMCYVGFREGKKWIQDGNIGLFRAVLFGGGAFFELSCWLNFAAFQLFTDKSIKPPGKRISSGFLICQPGKDGFQKKTLGHPAERRWVPRRPVWHPCTRMSGSGLVEEMASPWRIHWLLVIEQSRKSWKTLHDIQ